MVIVIYSWCHGNPKPSIFRGYNPYFGGGKTFIFHDVSENSGSFKTPQKKVHLKHRVRFPL